MSVLPAFALDRPASLDEALEMISEEAVPYSGGTELLLAMRAGFLRPDRLVDLKRVPELGQITIDDTEITIGGGVTHAEASRHDGVRRTLPVLAEALTKVGNPRVRAAGTLGGNLVFAEPKSDVATILMALNATVSLVRGTGHIRSARDVSVTDFMVGPYTTTREVDEILTEIRIPLDPDRRMAYVKYQTMERPTIGIAVSATSVGALIVIGAIGPIPQTFQAPSLDAFNVEEILASLDVIEDLTGADDYKRHIAGVMIRRAIEKAGLS